MKRLPAEWEPQDAVLLIWPHEATDWADCLPDAHALYLRLAAAITRFERLLVAAVDPDTVRRMMQDHGLDPQRITLVQADSNDTWARDCGPITLVEDGLPVLLDFTFNGWGGKFRADLDNTITRTLHQAGAFGSTPLRPVNLVLEGGSIESDGKGTLLTTSTCLLNPNRNPDVNPGRIEARLCAELGAHSVLWLEHGALSGDDTDAHIDTLARLAPGNTVLYMQCDDPSDPHYEPLRAMKEELDTMPFTRRIPLPWPAPACDPDGRRLPATYANFLVINDAVLVPFYGNPERDTAAADAIGSAFPGRSIVGIDCSILIRQNGSLHCITMQLPRGVLAGTNRQKARIPPF